MFKAKFGLFALAMLLVMVSIMSSNSSILAGSVPSAIGGSPSTPQSSSPGVGLLNFVFDPGTDDAYVNEVYGDLSAQGDISFFKVSSTSHWDPAATATNDGASADQGEPLTLTYSFIPDGTNMPSQFGGDTDCDSVLMATLDGLYGAADWRKEIAEIFALEWEAKTGNQYVFEANDDGAAWPNSPGILGLRGDLRIGGCAIDGKIGILAYNFFPNLGDMKIEVTDNFFKPGNLNTGFHNVLSHEHGHGAGVSHVCPVNQTKLMEPMVSLAFIGMQHDDIRAAQRLYGDFNEVIGGGGNDTAAQPTDFGAPAEDAPIVVSEVSIDDDRDEDWYRFVVGASKYLDVTVSPVGFTYLAGPPTGDGNCSPGTPTNSLAVHDLGFEVIDSDGTTVLAAVNTSGPGFHEAVSSLALGAAGPKFIRVFGDVKDDTQLYDLSFAVSPVLVPGLVFAVQPTDTFAGNIITPPVEVAAQDGFGNTIVDFTGDINVAIDASNPSSAAVLSGTTVVAAVSGIATFTDLRLDSGGAAYTLSASATDLADGVSFAFTSNPTTTTVAVGDRPIAVAINSMTNKAYVANSNSDNVTVIDGNDNSTVTVATGDLPGAVAVNPVTNRVYVVNLLSDNMTVIDGSDNTTSTVAVGSAPIAVAVNSVTNRVYVANRDSDNVTVINGSDQTTATVAAGIAPTALAVNPVTDQVYVAGGDVTVIDGSDNSTTALDVGDPTVAVAVNAVTNKVYLVNHGGVTVIDGSDLSITTVPAGDETNAVAVNPVTNKVYAVNTGDNTVTVIDGSDNSFTTVAVGNAPNAVAMNPLTNQVYVVNLGTDNVTVIDGSDNRTTTVAAWDFPTAVAVNSVTNKVYVANEQSDNVTVIEGRDNGTMADLSLSKTVNNSSPSEADTVVYTLAVSNGGPDGATGIRVTDNLLPALSFWSEAASQGSYDNGSGVWSVGALDAGAGATLELTAIINSGTAGSNIINSAEVTASDQADPDSTPDNNVPAEDDQDSADIDIQAARALIDNVVASNGTTYPQDILLVGNLAYVDRNYTFTDVPGEYIGQEMIITANSDKTVDNLDFLTFDLTADATVYVLFDDRVVTLPAWLNNETWILTSDIIDTSDVSRRIYQKDYLAGAVKLGGNAMTPMSGAGSNYNVVAIAGGPGGPDAPETTITSSPTSVSNSPDATFTFTSSKAGVTFECQLDGSGFGPCTSPQLYSALATGGHTFQVRGAIPAGDLAPTLDSHSWIVDANTAAGPLVSNIVVGNGKTYLLDSLDVGKVLYTDRDFTFNGMPGEYIGQELIIAVNSDKTAVKQNFLTFDLTADATVYVLFDDRVSMLPAWLDDPAWILTGDTIDTTDKSSRRVYRKDYVAGAVELGGNAMAPMSGAVSNYNVVAIASRD